MKGTNFTKKRMKLLGQGFMTLVMFLMLGMSQVDASCACTKDASFNLGPDCEKTITASALAGSLCTDPDVTSMVIIKEGGSRIVSTEQTVPTNSSITVTEPGWYTYEIWGNSDLAAEPYMLCWGTFHAEDKSGPICDIQGGRDFLNETDLDHGGDELGTELDDLAIEMIDCDESPDYYFDILEPDDFFDCTGVESVFPKDESIYACTDEYDPENDGLDWDQLGIPDDFSTGIPIPVNATDVEKPGFSICAIYKRTWYGVDKDGHVSDEGYCQYVFAYRPQQTWGPVYPPPGGVDFGTVGTSAGNSGGITFEFNNFDETASETLFWGPASASAVQAGLNGSLSNLTFSGISGNVASWSETTNWNDPESVFDGSVEVCFTMTLSSGSWIEASEIGLDVGAVVEVIDGADFDVTLEFFADNNVGTCTTPLNTVLQAPSPPDLTRSMFNGGFFGTTPVIIPEGPIEVELNCDDTDPDPTSLGAPYIVGIDGERIILEPGGKVCKYVTILEEGEKQYFCPQSYKQLLTWTVIDWCTGEIVGGESVTQLLIVEDKEAPTVTQSGDIAFEANPFDCYGNLTISTATGKDNCSDVLTWKTEVTITPPGGHLTGSDPQFHQLESNGGSIHDVPIGSEVFVEWFASDECDNTSFPANATLAETEDNRAPVVIANDELNVTLIPTDDGLKARIYPEDVDDTSQDNCGIKSMEISLDGETYEDYLTLDCQNTGDPFVVFLKVIDNHDNESVGWGKINLEDKSLPIVDPPAAMEIICGEVPPSEFGEPTIVYRGCQEPTIEELEPTESPIACGIGLMTRSWRVTANNDAHGDAATYVISQDINVVRGAPDWEMEFPENVDGMACDDVLPPKPDIDDILISDTGCNNWKLNVKDTEYHGSEDEECYKVFRTFTVINWCADDESSLAIKEPVVVSDRELTHETEGTLHEFDPINVDDYGKFSYVQVFVICCVKEELASAIVTGNFSTEKDEVIDDVMVKFSGPTLAPYAQMYSGFFNYSVPMHTEVTIKPEKELGYMNGISTGDLVKLQRHILGVSSLTSAYQVIAADVTKDDNVDTRDMLHISRLILGIYDEFPNSNSWRFVAKDHEFTNPLQPWGFPEVANYQELTQDINIDFIGVKVGDLTGNASPSLLTGDGSEQPIGKLQIAIDDKVISAGERYTVEFKAEDFTDFAGYQFTLGINESLIFESFEAGQLPNLGDANFGLNRLDNGIITTSWSNVEGITLQDGAELFSMTFTANETVRLSQVLSVNSTLTRAEAYNNDLEVFDVEALFNRAIDTEFELFQNRPNPFSGETVIGFNMPKAGRATLKVMDIAGKVIKEQSGEFSRGYNEISLSKSALQATGVLYYQLDSETHSATKKMIVIE